MFLLCLSFLCAICVAVSLNQCQVYDRLHCNVDRCEKVCFHVIIRVAKRRRILSTRILVSDGVELAGTDRHSAYAERNIIEPLFLCSTRLCSALRFLSCTMHRRKRFDNFAPNFCMHCIVHQSSHMGRPSCSHQHCIYSSIISSSLSYHHVLL